MAKGLLDPAFAIRSRTGRQLFWVPRIPAESARRGGFSAVKAVSSRFAQLLVRRVWRVCVLIKQFLYIIEECWSGDNPTDLPHGTHVLSLENDFTLIGSMCESKGKPKSSTTSYLHRHQTWSIYGYDLLQPASMAT